MLKCIQHFLGCNQFLKSDFFRHIRAQQRKVGGSHDPEINLALSHLPRSFSNTHYNLPSPTLHNLPPTYTSLLPHAPQSSSNTHPKLPPTHTHNLPPTHRNNLPLTHTTITTKHSAHHVPHL
jgi:hypothetical protein